MHCCIPSPFLTKYLELFNNLGHPTVKPKGNDFVYVPYSPAAEATAINPVLTAAVLKPNEESPGKVPTPFDCHKPNIGACCVPLSCTWGM